MNYLSLQRPRTLRKALSVLAITALVAGGISSLALTSQVNAQTVLTSEVAVVPDTGRANAGRIIDVYFTGASTTASLSLDGSCTVNGVEVGSTWQHLSQELYKAIYIVGSSDPERAAGTLPIDCHITDGTDSQQITAFTVANSLAIDTNDDGVIGGSATTTPSFISEVGAIPNTGTIQTGGSLQVYLQAPQTMNDVEVDGSCKVNGVEVGGSLENLTDGLYRLTYHVGSSDSDRAAGMIPLSCMLKNSGGGTTTVGAFTDSNMVAISASGTTTPPGGNGSQTGGQIGGDVGDAQLAVTSVTQVQGTATAGGGYGSGWSWVFHVTVPSNEDHLKLKFADWNHSNGTNHISAGGNMRFSSEQANSTSTISIGAADAYSAALALTGDADANTAGRQVDIKVEMQVPTGTVNGSYTTNYGIKSE